MNSQRKNVILVITSIILSFILYYPFGKLYELIIGMKVTGSFWGPDPLLLAGSILAITFIFPFIMSFGQKSKYYYIVIFIVIEIFIFYGYQESLLVSVLIFLSGLILGLLFNQAYLKFVKKS